ncbi:hypothetical protein BN7_3075 [Wickerhamomyces ciferrii]|uniref:Protein SIP5 n=1 Tax=Wickerhamomyces ciferrii (strain ATCC 14091 / BCRC 22168 / CBS 111 / JCM 3599 / NBRC 0793 / NRRL Y-1031 F-60-10) TaxID=1206466 RepID=K0KQ05_WICCF|nr:uncharacterized protein BN7_3075 [Wickerhamomyces ciferrii]CCH43524.1 hypothetical protein BN7_3075 [Wickerhamomyces ciferrii]
MGNVPTKEDRGSQSSRRRGSSISSTINGLNPNSSSPFPAQKLKLGKRSSNTKEKEKFKEAHAAGLVVKYDENVDGGYLAPYGTYNLNLDYKISVVKQCIIDRKLAPFYTPLQDHNKNWTDEELLKTVDSLKLHAHPSEADDEDEDLNYEYEDIDETTLSKRELKKHLSKKFNKQLKVKRLKWQDDEELRYRQEKSTSKQASSKDLKLILYRNVAECPICFLYYPKWLNYSRCCVQPICTECFVQIKRLDPHFPHDNDEEDVEDKAKNDPNLLISEPACCPYCATANFGVTYTPPFFRTGLNGDFTAGLFKLPSSEAVILEGEETSSFDVDDNYFKKSMTDATRSSSNSGNGSRSGSPSGRRGSLSANNPAVITTDFIRPDWEQKLNSARARLAKRAATASAIHASNLLIQNNEQDVEQRMIEEAMRLSLMDEEARKRRDSSSRR